MTTNEPRRGALARWAWIAAFWLGLGLVDAMQTVLIMRAEGMHHDWFKLFAVTVASWLPWAAATPTIVRLGRRFRPGRRRPAAIWSVHIGAGAAVALAFAAWTSLLHVTFNPYADAQVPSFLAVLSDTFANGLLSVLVLYCGILAVDYGLESRDRLARAQTEAARLNASLSEAQLNALRRQIEPHFLFNALNSVAGLVRDDQPQAAVRTIAALGDLLRRMLADAHRHEVPLSEEMQCVRDYVAIAQVRFADRLAVRENVPADLGAALVPNFILQPLVENAIVHGIAHRAQGGIVDITASRSEDALILRVWNDGPNTPAVRTAARPGVGLPNVRTRLRGLYGAAADIQLCKAADGRVDVWVRLPLHVAPVPATVAHA